MAFFKRGAAAKKKGPIGNKKPKKSGDAAVKRTTKPTADDEISSDSDAFVENVDEGTDDEVFEDAQAKAFREAKRVLEKLKVFLLLFFLLFIRPLNRRTMSCGRRTRRARMRISTPFRTA